MANEKRLIEADALMKRFRIVAQSGGPVTYHVSDICAAIEDEAEETTVDAVEVVHGRWIDKPTGAYRRWQSWCSACGKHSGIGGIESNRHKPYCPNCGAKMDGGSNHAEA